MTNKHVLSSIEDVAESIAQFRYERTIQGAETIPVEFSLLTNPAPIFDDRLDVALVAVGGLTTSSGVFVSRSAEAKIDDFGWLRLNPTPGKAFIGEYLTIIQHPNGERKQVCVRENRLLKYDPNGPFLWYQTDTVGGSSGSPVFNNSWEVVGLHHSGVPRTMNDGRRVVWLTKDGKQWNEDMGDDQIDWIANEGIRISKIHEFLKTSHAANPLSQLVTRAAPAPWEEAFFGADHGTAFNAQQSADGITRIMIPVEIGIRIPFEMVQPKPKPLIAAPTHNSISTPPPAGVLEAAQIDVTNYDKRNGYDPNFLGTDALSIPLPKLAAETLPKMLKIKGHNGELKYWNYSVVMNEERGLAFFSAANIDPALGKGSRGAEGFIRDSRVDAINKNAQVGQSFYKKQKTFEVEDRSKNPFDQGHLTRREDLQWGRTDAIAKRNGDDSFHYTNCAPQHVEFNQERAANGLWNRLEQMARHIADDGAQFCVFNGPIFDAPLCTKGPDGRLHLDLLGSPSKDPKFGGVSIPKQFFKIIAWADDNKLRVSAFVVTQEDLLARTNRIHPDEAFLTDDEVRLYQVSLADLEKATQLRFGKLTRLSLPVSTN